jgi:hypothetical protein
MFLIGATLTDGLSRFLQFAVLRHILVSYGASCADISSLWLRSNL